MRFTCDKCGRVYAVAGELSGRAFKMKCKACGQTITVQPDEPLTPPVPEENPFVVTPVRATRIQHSSSRPPPAAETRREAPAAVLAEAAARPAPEPRAGATVHVLSPVAEDLGPSSGRLALAVNDLFADVEPEIEEFRPRPEAVPAPREPVRPQAPARAAPPPRRRLGPVAVAALLGVALGGAGVGVALLRGRASAPQPRPPEPVAAAPASTPLVRPEPRPAPEAPAAAAEVAVAQPEPVHEAAEAAEPEAQPRHESARAMRERRAASAPAAVEIPAEEQPARPAPHERRTASSKPALAPAEPAPEPVAEPALPQASAVASAPPAPRAQDEAPRFAGSGFKSPRLANRNCIAENLALPEQAESLASSTLTVKLAVSATGAASQVQVLAGTQDPRVVDAIRKAVGGCAWVPGADAEGKPTSLWVVQPIRLAR